MGPIAVRVAGKAFYRFCGATDLLYQFTLFCNAVGLRNRVPDTSGCVTDILKIFRFKVELPTLIHGFVDSVPLVSFRTQFTSCFLPFPAYLDTITKEMSNFVSISPVPSVGVRQINHRIQVLTWSLT